METKKKYYEEPQTEAIGMDVEDCFLTVSLPGGETEGGEGIGD